MPSELAKVMHRNQAGTAAAELALVLPLLLLVLGGAADFSLAYAQATRLSGAAQLGAQAAAEAMSGQRLDGGLSLSAQAAADDAVRAALPDIPPGQLVVETAWDGAEQVAQRPAPDATLAVNLPDLVDEQTTLDFRHGHGASYAQPTFGWANWGQWQQPGVWYLDRLATTSWKAVSYSSAHPYQDLWNSPWYARPNGPFWGVAFPVVGVAAGWWSGFDDRVAGQSAQWWSRWTNWVTAWDSVQSAGSPPDAWRRTQTQPFFLPDEVTTQTGWQWLQTATSTDGPVVTVGPYVRQRGTRQQEIPSQPAVITIHQRLVRVTVRTQARPVTPMLRAILGGRLINGSAVAPATTITP